MSTTIDELIAYGIETKDYMKDFEPAKYDLSFYRPPKVEEMKKKIFRGFISLDITKIGYPKKLLLCGKTYRFQAKSRRTEGTYSKYASLDDKMDGFHYYTGIKFGLGRCMEDAAHEIRDGHLTREEVLL